MYVACGSLVPACPMKTFLVSRDPIRLASPGFGFASCTTIGTRRRLAARYPGVAT